MNRLIIIGNGFDLAHGMATRYSDFVKSYLIKIFKGLESNKYSDDGVTAQRILRYSVDHLRIIEDLDTNREDIEYLTRLLNNSTHPDQSQMPYTFHFNFTFVKKMLLLFTEKKWVDIENEYYQELLKIANGGHLESQIVQVDKLNKGLEVIKNELEICLSSLPKPKLIKSLFDIFKSPVKPTEIIGSINFESTAPKKTHILNFNYTDSISKYFDGSEQAGKGLNGTVNYIHGKINTPLNPLIFGFGDEMDDHYKILEKLNYNGFLDNMKSFGYFKTENYHELIHFIKDEDFEIFIMGHSCGLSDRVMLNMIFEHTNCKSIRIFYHQEGSGNNFKILTQEISRHFNSKVEMRRKIVPFNKCIPLPQIA